MATYFKSGFQSASLLLFHLSLTFLLSIYLTWTIRTIILPEFHLLRIPVNFFFEPCPSGVGVCSFPTANVSLKLEGRNLFMRGLPYQLQLELDLIDSFKNRELGMFQAVVSVFGDGTKKVATFSRFSVYRYQSWLVRNLKIIFLLPFYLLGALEEAQRVNFEFGGRYTDSPFEPARYLTIEVQSRDVQIRDAHLQVQAIFGLARNFLSRWPLVSGFLIFSIIFSFLFTLTTVYWMQRVTVYLFRAIDRMDNEVENEGAEPGQDQNTPTTPATPTSPDTDNQSITGSESESFHSISKSAKDTPAAATDDDNDLRKRNTDDRANNNEEF